MGYAFYTLPDGREAGYGVEAECDREDCTEQINRGLGYLCGDNPDGHRDPDAPGCGKYFCEPHQADHDCSNLYGVLDHAFVGDPDEDECEALVPWRGQKDSPAVYPCEAPRSAHEDSDG